MHAALRIGALCGAINVIAPDHLGTLMTLSALCALQEAFYIGVWWGIGHSVGTILICCVVMVLKALAVAGIDAYEHYGEYIVGASLIFCALYFAFNEHKYLKEKEDGTVAAVPCSCHSFSVQPHTSNIDTNPDLACTPCTGTMTPMPKSGSTPSASKKTSCFDPHEDAEVQENTPLLPHNGNADRSDELSSGRGIEGACIGLIQGMCCPTGLVGISFVARMGNSTEIVVFLTAFILVSVVGTGLVAVGWSVITDKGMGDYVGPRIVYRGSCVFTLVLGIAWISATYSGWSIDYTDQINDQLNLTAATKHNQTVVLARTTLQALLKRNSTHTFLVKFDGNPTLTRA